MDIGGALKSSRKKRNLSIEEVSRRTGVTRQCIARLEQGDGRLASVERVMKCLRIRIDGLTAHDQPISVRIRMAREEAGLTVSQVSRAAGVAENSVRALEGGNSTLKTLAKVGPVVAPGAQVVALGKVWRTVATAAGSVPRQADDYYATPAPIVRLLLDKVDIPDNWTLLEPCAGEARSIPIVMAERGRLMTCYDINAVVPAERRDFFDLDEVHDQHDAIITNPPFRHNLEWILQSKKLARHMIALLLPLNYLTGSVRHAQIWQDEEFALSRVLVFNRGLNFLNDPFSDRLGASQLYCAWYVWERGHVGAPALEWMDNQALISKVSTNEA